MKAYVLVLWLLGPFFIGVAHGQIILNEDPSQPLTGAVFYYEDSSTVAMQLDHIQQLDGQWLVLEEAVFSKGYTPSYWWLKIEVGNETNSIENRFIEISYAHLDHINVFIVDAERTLSQFKLGDKYPYHQRPVESPNFVFPVQWQPQQQLTLYIQVYGNGAIQVPLKMWQQGAYYQHQLHLENVQGAYWGGILMIIVYNLLLFLALRDRTYLWYVVSILFIGLTFTSLNGQAYRFLWPNAPKWNEMALVILICLACSCSSVFISRFLNLRKIAPALNKLVYGVILLSLVVIPLSFAEYHMAIQLAVGFCIVLSTLGLVAGVYGSLQGGRGARLLLLAWSTLLIGTLTITLNKIGIIPINFFTNNAAQIGSLLEAVLLSFALADRINEEKAMRFAAQQDLLQASEKMQQDLERAVAERTEDLETLNQKLEMLSKTDQLTGLNNRRFLEQMIEEEFLRCARYKHPISILMIDVDHFKSVNDRYGHASGDECLKMIAMHMRGGIRKPADVAARYGGEEFCILMPETTLKGATSVAERIRESVLGAVISCESGVFSVSLSIGIYTHTEGEYNGEQALKNADAALYRAKYEGRNRVMVHAA